MEEAEVPLEGVQEETHHHAAHAKERWISGVALSSAILAVLAAVTAMLSGARANEAVIEQIRASDQWALYQAKAIKASLLTTKVDLYAATGKEAPGKDRDKLEKYEQEKEAIADAAKELEEASKKNLETHEVLARGVTLFQVAIAIAAIAALTRRRTFWFAGLAFGGVGCYFLAAGLLAG
jgi:hypothetical protein